MEVLAGDGDLNTEQVRFTVDPTFVVERRKLYFSIQLWRSLLEFKASRGACSNVEKFQKGRSDL